MQSAISLHDERVSYHILVYIVCFICADVHVCFTYTLLDFRGQWPMSQVQVGFFVFQYQLKDGHLKSLSVMGNI